MPAQPFDREREENMLRAIADAQIEAREDDIRIRVWTCRRRDEPCPERRENLIGCRWCDRTMIEPDGSTLRIPFKGFA